MNTIASTAQRSEAVRSALARIECLASRRAGEGMRLRRCVISLTACASLWVSGRALAQNNGVGNLRQLGAVGRGGSQNIGNIGGNRLSASFGAGYSRGVAAPTGPLGAGQSIGRGDTPQYLGNIQSQRGRNARTQTGSLLIDNSFRLGGLQSNEIIARSLSAELLDPPLLPGGLGVKNIAMTTQFEETYRNSQPLDRYGDVFPREKLRTSPLLPPGTGLGVGPSRDPSPSVLDAAPYAPPRESTPIDVFARARQDRDYYLKRALERFYVTGETRLARQDFEMVNLLSPSDPRGFLGAAIAAADQKDINYCLLAWKLSLKRFAESGAGLESLRLDISVLDAPSVRARDGESRVLGRVRRLLEQANVTPESQPALEGLQALLINLLGERESAVEKARRASERDGRLPADKRQPGLLLLYQRLRESSEQITSVSPPTK